MNTVFTPKYWETLSTYHTCPNIQNSPFYFFWVGFYGPSKNISLILDWAFIKDGRKPENPGKNHLAIRKQNLAFPHVTQVRLKPQWWKTFWIKSHLSYPLGYRGPAPLLPVDVLKILLYVWQLCSTLQHLIWVYTICNGLSVSILKVITVLFSCKNNLIWSYV